MAGSTANNQSEGKLENSCKLTWLLTEILLKNTGRNLMHFFLNYKEVSVSQYFQMKEQN